MGKGQKKVQAWPSELWASKGEQLAQVLCWLGGLEAYPWKPQGSPAACSGAAGVDAMSGLLAYSGPLLLGLCLQQARTLARRGLEGPPEPVSSKKESGQFGS